MKQVLDYSAGFPGAVAVKSAGYGGAVRYIGFPDRRKCTTAAELKDFSSHGLGMALVFEGAATDWRGGFSAGRDNGRRARDDANMIGFPADRPIYMAVDQDVVRAGEFATMVEYLRGATASLGGPGRTGVYGEADVIDRARDAGVATYFWQTAAWSRGRRTTAHLFQRVGAVTVGGIACDINDVLTPDWGQHNPGGHMGTVEDSEAGTRTYFQGTTRPNVEAPTSGGTRSLEQVIFVTNEWVNEILILLRRMDGTLSDDEARIIAALAGVKSELLVAVAAVDAAGVITNEQLDELAEKLRLTLGDAAADELVRRLQAGKERTTS